MTEGIFILVIGVLAFAAIACAVVISVLEDVGERYYGNGHDP